MIYMGIPIAALVLLVVLLIEHSIMQRAENPDFAGKVFLEIIGFTTLEVINWSVWLALLSNTSSLFSMTSLIASAYFFVGFYIEHQITENVITQGVILETLSEGVGARLWISYGLAGMGPVAIIFLIIGSTIEHSIQYVVGRVPVQSQITARVPA